MAKITPAELQKELARRTLARRRMLQFTKATHPNYEAGWVHEDICRRLEKFSADVAAGKSPRLMLLMPPRHGKSELASIRFPAWHLGQHPDHEVINVGYNLDLPMIFSRKVRELVRDPAYLAIFPKAALDPSSQSIEKWVTKAGGGFTAAGVGGGITGKGAHILIIDDPIKNQAEADSILTRDNLLDWYQSTAYTRLAPGGGVLVIECMTGETPVLLADGTERRLDQMRVGDEVATYENGRLAATRVAGWKRSGRDSVLKITMASGRVVRANGRHPFLVSTIEGLKWIRARSLSTGTRIVTVKDSVGSGLESSALLRAATQRQNVVDCAKSTTGEKSGPTDTALPPSTPRRSARGTSSTATASRWKSSSSVLRSRVVSALSAVSRLKARLLRTGKTSSASTTVMKPGPSEGCSATAATLQSDTLELSGLHSPWPSTFDFTLDPVVRVEPDGEEDVYDLQIERTENFIANGAVTHNTWWHDDDLAGRLQMMMAADPAADQFDVVRYPALSEAWEYRDNTTGKILRFDEEQEEDLVSLELLRPKDFCLHEARYPNEALKRIRANLQPRIWSALYQQNPVPDEGMYFKQEYFRFEPTAPPITQGTTIFTGWDFAIGEKQQNDWTVGATILQDHNDVLHVIDIHRMKGDSFQIVEAMLEVAQRYNSTPGVSYQIGAEDGQIWRAIHPLLKKRMLERGIFPAYEVMRPLTDKMARARPLQGRMQQGRVVFAQNAGWSNQAQQELLRFPAGQHDDVVDALAWAVHLCMGKEPPKLYTAPPLPSWKDKLQFLDNTSGTHMSA